MPRFLRLAGAVFLAVAMLTATGAPPAAAASLWEPADPPLPDYQPLNDPELRAFGADSAVMVAPYFPPSECDWVCPINFLRWQWNGTTWSEVPRPPLPSNTFLDGFAAVSPTDQWVFDSGPGGAFRTYHWNGSTWTTATVPSVNFAPDAATATGAGNVWVAGTGKFGNSYKPAVARWNGTAWTVTALPGSVQQIDPRAIHVAAANEVWVIGSSTQNHLDYGLYVARWNGSTWTQVSTGTGTGRGVVAAAAAVAGTPGDIWVTGTDPATKCGLTLHWTGSAFAKQTLCQASQVSAVTKYGTDWIAGLEPPASGTAPDGALRRWNGSAWQSVRGPYAKTTRVTRLAAAPGGGTLWVFAQGTDAAGTTGPKRLWRLTGSLS